MAHSVTFLEPDEIAVLQEGVAMPRGNAALIAAGTGLGEALLHNVNGRFMPSPSEAGHADFAPRNLRELALAEFFMRERDRVEVETFLSGPGLVNVYRFVHNFQGSRSDDLGCEGVRDGSDAADAPPQITEAALRNECGRCVETLSALKCATRCRSSSGSSSCWTSCACARPQLSTRSFSVRLR
jgi:glucokinase